MLYLIAIYRSVGVFNNWHFMGNMTKVWEWIVYMEKKTETIY